MSSQDSLNPDSLRTPPLVDVAPGTAAETIMDTDIPDFLLGTSQDAEFLHGTLGLPPPLEPDLVLFTPTDSPMDSMLDQENVAEHSLQQLAVDTGFADIASHLSASQLDEISFFFTEATDETESIDISFSFDEKLFDSAINELHDNLSFEGGHQPHEETTVDTGNQQPHSPPPDLLHCDRPCMLPADNEPSEDRDLGGGIQPNGEIANDTGTQRADPPFPDQDDDAGPSMLSPNLLMALDLQTPMDEPMDLAGNKPLNFRRFAWHPPHPTGSIVEDPFHPANIWSPWTSIDFEGGLPPAPGHPFLDEDSSSSEDESISLPDDWQTLQNDPPSLGPHLDQNNYSFDSEALQEATWAPPAQILGTDLPGNGDSSNRQGEILSPQNRRGSLPEPLYITPVGEHCQAYQFLPPSAPAFSLSNQIKENSTIDGTLHSLPVRSVTDEKLVADEPADPFATPPKSPSQDPPNANEELEEEICETQNKKESSIHDSDSGVSSSFDTQERISDWILDPRHRFDSMAPQQHQPELQVFTATIQDGAIGGANASSTLPGEETMTVTPVTRMKDIDVAWYHSKMDAMEPETKKRFKQLLESIPKLIKSIRPTETQTVKSFSPALRGTDLLAPDSRASHEIFRRGQIVSWEVTGKGNQDALITVEFLCPTLETDCRMGVCPHCHGKEYEHVQYFFPARGAADKHWLLIVGHLSEFQEKLKALNNLFKDLFSYLSDPNDDVGFGDSVSQVSDRTDFPEDPDPSTAKKVPVNWETSLNWPQGLNTLTGGAILQSECDKLKGRIQGANDQILRLEYRDTLPYEGECSLAKVLHQGRRFFTKKEDYINDVSRALSQLSADNCTSSASELVRACVKITMNLLAEARVLIEKDMEKRFNNASNQWHTRWVDSIGMWENYKTRPEPEGPRREPSPGRSSTRSRRHSHSPTGHQEPPGQRHQSPPLQRRTRRPDPVVHSSPVHSPPAHKDTREAREIPSTKRQQKFKRYSPSPSGSESESGGTSSSSASSVVSTVLRAHSTEYFRPRSPPNRGERVRTGRSSTHSPPGHSVFKQENSDFARIVGSKRDLRHYCQQVSAQLNHYVQDKGSKIKKSGRKLQQETQSWIEIMLRHNQPSFSAISEFTEAQLKEEVDVGNNERRALDQRIGKAETAVALALSDLVSALSDSKHGNVDDWSKTTELVEGLLKGPKGRTHLDLQTAWAKFYLSLTKRIKDAAKKRNVIKNSQKSSMTAKDLIIPKFSGESEEENFYVWEKGFMTVVQLGGFTQADQILLLGRALVKEAKIAVGTMLNGSHPILEVIEFLRERYGRPSVIISQAKDRHNKIGSLGKIQLATTDRQDQKIIMTKLDAHLKLITEVEQVEVGLGDHEISKLPPGSTSREEQKERRRATKKVLTEEYLLTLKYLTPLAPDQAELRTDASPKEKFLHYKLRLNRWRDVIQLEFQERPASLKSASAHAVLVADRAEPGACLTAAAQPQPQPQPQRPRKENPPQTLAGSVPKGEVPTRLQTSKENARQSGRGRQGGRGNQSGRPGKPKRSQSEPPRCAICQSRGEEEYHGIQDCPHKSTPRLDTRVCCVCMLFLPQGERASNSPHILIGNQVQRHFCGVLKDMKVSQSYKALLDKGWCLSCLVPPRLHKADGNHVQGTERTCDRKGQFQCTVCNRHSKTCVEHFSQNKGVHEESTRMAKELGLTFNCSLVVTRDEGPCEPRGADLGDQISLFASTMHQPELEIVNDPSLKSRLEPQVNLLQGLQMELPSKKIVFVLFDNGSTENMATSDVVGIDLKARTHPDLPPVRIRGYGGHREVRTVEMDIPVKQVGIAKMIFQETKDVLPIKMGSNLPLLALMKKEFKVRQRLGLLGKSDTRENLDHVHVTSYGGEIKVLFGITAGLVWPRRLFLSVTGAFIFSTSLDTGRCPPYGVAGPHPNLEDYAKFVAGLERKEPSVLEEIEQFLAQQKNIVDLNRHTLLAVGRDEDQGAAKYIDTELPDLPGWVPKDLVREVKNEMRDDSLARLVTRHQAQQNIPGASNAVHMMQQHLPALFKLFQGELVASHPASSWKLLAEGANRGPPLLMEIADWLWARINSSPQQVGVSLGLSGEEFDELPPASGYLMGLVSETPGNQDDFLMDPEDWIKPESIRSWLTTYGKKAEISGMSKSETADGAMALLDIHSAPIKCYVSWYEGQRIPGHALPTAWDTLLAYFPRYLAELNGEPLHHSMHVHCGATKDVLAPAASLPPSRTWSSGQFNQGPLLDWFESERFSGLFYLGLSNTNLQGERKELAKLINRWLEPEQGELKTIYTFAKRLGREYGRFAESAALLGHQVDLESTFLSVPALNELGLDSVFQWIHMILMLTGRTNLSTYEKKRVFLRALQPRLLPNLFRLKKDKIIRDLRSFLSELYRVITQGRNYESRAWENSHEVIQPPFGVMKESRSGCSRFYNAILDPGAWDEERQDGLVPITFPVLNSLDPAAVTYWAHVCNTVIYHLELASETANQLVLGSVALALRPVLFDTYKLSRVGRELASPTNTLLEIQSRLTQVNNTGNSMVFNIMDFFLEKFTAMRRDIKHSSVHFTCQPHVPSPCGPRCLCLGCWFCNKPCAKKLQYSKQVAKYVWIDKPSQECFSCQGLTFNPTTGAPCDCQNCRLFNQVLSFGLEELLQDDKNVCPLNERPGTARFDTMMARRYNPDRYHHGAVHEENTRAKVRQFEHGPSENGEFESGLQDSGHPSYPILHSALTRGHQAVAPAHHAGIQTVRDPAPAKKEVRPVVPEPSYVTMRAPQPVEPEPCKPCLETSIEMDQDEIEAHVSFHQEETREPLYAQPQVNNVPPRADGPSECGYHCKKGCVVKSNVPCVMSENYPERRFLWDRRDRLPDGADIKDMDGIEVRFWHKHFKNEEEMGGIDYSKRDLYRILVKARTTAWTLIGCKKCRSAITRDDIASRANCPAKCEQRVTEQEVRYHREDGIRFRAGHPTPFLEAGLHIPLLKDMYGRLSAWPHLPVQSSPALLSETDTKVKVRPGAPPMRAPKDWKQRFRTVLHAQFQHNPVAVEGLACCSSGELPAIYYESEKDAKIFKNNLEQTCKEFLIQKNTGELVPRPSSDHRRMNKKTNVTLKATNDNNIDLMLSGLFEAYTNHRRLIANLLMSYPHYEVSLKCAPACFKGCLTPELGCFCEGCPSCQNFPGFENCFLAFARQLQKEFQRDKLERTGLIISVLRFDLYRNERNASFLTLSGCPNSTGKQLPLRQSSYRRKMAELRVFSTQFPEARVTSSCRTECEKEGRCQGVDYGCYCDGCLFCSETIGLGKTYLELSEFTRRLRQDSGILKKVQALQSLNLHQEKQRAESKGPTDPRIRPAQPTPLAHQARRPFMPRVPFLSLLFCLLTLTHGGMGGTVTGRFPFSTRPRPYPGNTWVGRPVEPRGILEPPHIPVSPNSTSQLDSLSNQQLSLHPIMLKPELWANSLGDYLMEAANSLYLCTVSSVVALNSKGAIDGFFRRLVPKVRPPDSSHSLAMTNQRFPDEDPGFHRFLVRNTEAHRQAYWGPPLDPDLKKEIDKELAVLGRVTMVASNNSSEEEDSGLDSDQDDQTPSDCFHCHNGCPVNNGFEEDQEDEATCLSVTHQPQDMIEWQQEERLSPYMRCKTCQACKVCGKLGEAMNLKLRKNQENEYIRSCITIRDHPTEPGKKEIYMEYPKREGWEDKLAPNRGLAVTNLQSVAKTLLSEPAEAQEMVLSQMQKLIDNKFILPVEEVPGWDQLVKDCPVPGGYYTTHTLAYKPNSANTDVRLCANFSKECSTGKCFNNYLVQGNPRYNFRAFNTGTRQKPAMASSDISKFFNSVKLVDKDKVLCRILWFKDNNITIDETEYQELCLATGWYGAASQPCLMEHAKEEVWMRHPEISGISSEYVDDITTPAMDAITARSNMELLTRTYAIYQLNAKGIAVSGEAPDASLLGNGGYVDVGGMHWDSEKDLIQPVVNPVYVGKKVKGRLKNASVFTGNSLEEMMEWASQFKWTVKSISEQLARAWDYASGMISAARGEISTVLRASHDWAHLKGVEEGSDRRTQALWDRELPRFLLDRLLAALFIIQDYSKFWFPRCSIATDDLEDPNNPVFDLVTFVDAGANCLQAIHYILYKVKSKGKEERWKASYLWSSNKLRPVLPRKANGTQAQQTMPKSELAALALGAAGAVDILATNMTGVRKVFISTDSTCSIKWITSPNCDLDPYTNPRVQFIREHYDLDRVLYVRSEDQPADTGTKGIESAEEIGPNSFFYNGPPFLHKGVDACIGKELLTYEHIPNLQNQGFLKWQERMAPGVHSQKERNSATRRLEEMHNQWCPPKQHLTNLLIGGPTYLSQFGRRPDPSKAEVVISVAFTFTKAHLLSILTLAPRMNFLVDKQTNTLTLYSANDKPALHNKSFISTEDCDYSGVCFLLGKHHHHSPLTAAVSRQADEFLPPAEPDLTPVPPMKLPPFVDCRESPPGTLFNAPSPSSKELALAAPPSVLRLTGWPAQKKKIWSNHTNNVYVGTDSSIELGFLQEYWTSNGTSSLTYRNSFCSDTRHLRTIPFLKGKQLGCDCDEEHDPCHARELINIYKDYYTSGPESLQIPPGTNTVPPPSPQFLATLAVASAEKTFSMTKGTLSKMVKNDDMMVSPTRRPLDRIFTTVSLALFTVGKWYNKCATSTKFNSAAKWKKRIEGFRQWKTKNPYLTDLLLTNPLNALMGHSPEQQGRHTNEIKDKVEDEVTSEGDLDEFLRKAAWYHYPGFSMIFSFCRTVSRESNPSFEQLSFQFTSILLLLTSLLGMSKTKDTRPGLFTACRAALCWVKFVCKDLEANVLSALLDLPNLSRFYDSAPQQQRLQPQHNKRLLVRKWAQNFGISLKTTDIEHLPRYGNCNQVSILWATAELCQDLLRGAGYYLVFKTQSSHSAFSSKGASNKLGEVNEDGIWPSPRRIRQDLEMTDLLDIQNQEDRKKLRGLRLNKNVPYLPMSPLSLAIVYYVHFHFRHGPVKLFSNTKHRSTTLDALLIKAHVDGPGIVSALTRVKYFCFCCGLQRHNKMKARSGTIDDTLKPDYRVNDRVFADLAGPYKVGSSSVHILVWVCAGTGYVSAWPMSSRSRESFTRASKAMADMHNGYPSEWFTDRESGLISMLDGGLFEEKNGNTFQTIRTAIRVFLCAAYNHQAHGSVERRVRTIKELLGTLDWSALTFQDLAESLLSIVRLINSTPLAAKVQGEINPVIELISPQDLMTPGRTNSVVTPIVYHKSYEQMRDELASYHDAYVKTWNIASLDSRLSSQVFQEQSAEPVVGDVVVMQDPHSMKPRIQKGVIEELLPGEDGIVRKVAVRVVTRSKKVIGQVNSTISVRSIRDLCIVPKMDSHFGDLTLDLEERQKLVDYKLPDQQSDDGLATIEEETQPIEQQEQGASDAELLLKHNIKPCYVRLKRLPTPVLKDSRSVSLRSESRFNDKPPTIKRSVQSSTPPPTRVLRSSQSQALTMAFLTSLVVTSHCQPLSMSKENSTETVLPEVITAVGFDMSSTFTAKTPVVKHLNLLTSHTCETDETKYDKADARQLQAIFTRERVDVEIYQCRVLASLKASWCGSNLATTADSRMHAAVTVITPTILKLSSEQCKRMVEEGKLLANLYEYDGTKEFAKTFMEHNIPYGFSTREEVIRGRVLERHACLSDSNKNGPIYIKGKLFEQHVITRSLEILVRRHRGVYDSEYKQFSIPGLVSFNSTKRDYFENQHGTFSLANNFTAPDRCARTTGLFSGVADYYHRRPVGHQAGGEQKGDIVIMANRDNRSVAFVTAGMTEFCNTGPVFRTTLKQVHLVPYQSDPPFTESTSSPSGVDPYLNMKTQVGAVSVEGDLSVEQVAFSLHERACQLNTISNLVKLNLLAAMPEAKLLDTYHGLSIRRAGGVATVFYGVPLPVQLEHRVAGKGVCCAELSIITNGTDSLPHPTFMFSISRIITPHCTPVICSEQSPIYHAMPGRPVQDLLLKGDKLSWEDIHTLQKDYVDNDKTFWICDDSKKYYVCSRPPQMLTTSPTVEKSATNEILTPASGDEEPGGLWSDEQENQYRGHQWVTSALAATSQVLGVAMSGRHLHVKEMHQQIIELEPRAKTAIINGFFPSFWNIAEYIPQFMLCGMVLVASICVLMTFCCCYNTMQDVRTCTANLINSASLVTCNRRFVDEENAKLTILDVKSTLRQQAALTTDLACRVEQHSRELLGLRAKELADQVPPPYPEKE